VAPATGGEERGERKEKEGYFWRKKIITRGIFGIFTGRVRRQ